MSVKHLITLALIQITVSPGTHGDKLKGIAPVRPKVVDVPMGVLFKPESQEQFDELVSLGAAREITKNDDLDQYREFKLDKKEAHSIAVTGSPNAQTIEGVGTAAATVSTPPGSDADADADKRQPAAARVKATSTKAATTTKATGTAKAKTGEGESSDEGKGSGEGNGSDDKDVV